MRTSSCYGQKVSTERVAPARRLWFVVLTVAAITVATVLALAFPLGNTACAPTIPLSLSCFPDLRVGILLCALLLVGLGVLFGFLAMRSRSKPAAWIEAMLAGAMLIVALLGALILDQARG